MARRGEAVTALAQLDPELRVGTDGARSVVRLRRQEGRSRPGRVRPRGRAGPVGRNAPPSCSTGPCASTPEMRIGWRQCPVCYFLGRFRETADMIGDYTEFTRWDLFFATLCHAQLGDPAATARWRARFVESWPNYSFGLSVSPPGDFSRCCRRARAVARQLGQGGPPNCATPGRDLDDQAIARVRG